METNITNAFLLLGIGMITVFAVLSLVVLLGNVLIKLINKYSPETPPKKLITPILSNKEIALISAVVDHVTKGKGVVKSIEKN